MIKRSAAGALVALLAASAPAFQVVTTSGSRADGVGIVGFDEPQLDAGAIWFQSTSTSATVAGASFATGDPLPPGFAGTIEEILRAESAGSLGALLTSTTGPDVSEAVFLVDGGTASPIVTTAPSAPEHLRTFVMNSHGDVAWLGRSPAAGAFHLHPGDGGPDVLIAEPDRTLRTVRALVIDEARDVAWLDYRGRTVRRWDPTLGTTTAMEVTRAFRRGGASPIALHAPEGLVVAEHDAVVLQPPAGDGATLLSAGELVEGHGIQRVYGDVGFLDDGTVTIRVRARRAPGPYVCVTGDVKKFCDARGRPSAGTPVTIARAASIFRSRSGTVAALVRPGDDLPGAGPLADVEHFIVRGGSVTFVGILVDGRRVLARRSDHGTTVVAADGTTVGSYTITLSILYATRGTLSLVGATLVDASGAELEDASGLALINGRGAVDQLLRPRADRRFGTASAAVFTSGGPVVLSDNPDGLLALRRGRLHPVLVAGKRAARGVATLDAMAASGSSLVLLGTSASGGSALYALHAGRFGRLLALPDVPSAFAGGVGADVALVVTPSSPGAGDQAWTVHDGHATVVAAIGDATPLGTLESIDAVALDARTVVLASGVAGTGPHRALLTTPR